MHLLVIVGRRALGDFFIIESSYTPLFVGIRGIIDKTLCNCILLVKGLNYPLFELNILVCISKTRLYIGTILNFNRKLIIVLFT